MRLRHALPLCALALLAACDVAHLLTPRRPAGARRFTPPSIYAEWWALTEDCAARVAPFEEIAWYSVPGAKSLGTRTGRPIAGYWNAKENEIVPAEAWRFTGEVVRHEMLHAMLGVNDHPRASFLERCAGVVNCGSGCVADAGAPPAVDAMPVVAPSAVTVRLSMLPAAARAHASGDQFTLVLRVHNPNDHGVRVALMVPERQSASPWTFVWVRARSRYRPSRRCGREHIV